MSPRTRQLNPKVWLTAVIASSIIAVSYKLYNNYINTSEDSGNQDTNTLVEKNMNIKDIGKSSSDDHVLKKFKTNGKYTKKSIALTLSHSVLSSELPLNDILLNSENVTFILPPNLSLDDLACNIKVLNEEVEESTSFNGNDTTLSKSSTPTIKSSTINYKLPQTLIKNYKLLNCNNLKGYYNLIKNLEPDMLLVCADDLGIKQDFPADLNRFAKEIITIDQNHDEIYSTISKIFIK